MLVCFSAGTQFRHNFALTLCRFYAYFAPFRQAEKIFQQSSFFVLAAPYREQFCTFNGGESVGRATVTLAYLGGNRIGYAKVFRDEGERATTRYRPQEVPRFASGQSADRTYRCRKSHRQRRDIFGSARLCAVPLDLLTQACLLYDSLSSWGA